MISVLIPYTTKNPRWEHNELRYCLRSIAKNFDFDYDITIFTDGDIPWVKNVTVKRIDRYYPEGIAERFYNGTKHYEQFFDVLNKLKLASESNDLQEEILWVYDDVILVQKQSKEQIKTLYSGDSVARRKDYWLNPKGNKWKRTIFRALDLVGNVNNSYLYETHLPRYYKKTNLRAMFKQFPIETEVPYAPSTVYFNMFYDKPDYILRNPKIDNQMDNPIKAGFYGCGGGLCDTFPSRTDEQVARHTQNKLWINYNEAGMTEPLKNWIKKQFPKKCKYEK